MSKVLRASRAGFPCDRNLWYALNDYSGAEESESTRRIFDVGACLEPLVVEWLKRDGWEVTYNPGSQNAEIEIRVPLAGGEVRGHPDCLISRGNVRNVLVDIKTMNERSYQIWRRDGTVKAKPQYADQVHIYAQGLINAGYEIEHVGIVGVNKNNSDLHIDIFEFSPERIAEILGRSERLIMADDAPQEGSPRENWCCGYCEYWQICELCGKKKPDTLKLSEEVDQTEDESLIEAMRELQASRELAKTSREMESHAKERLDEYVKMHGNRSVAGGGLMFSLTERERGTFDSNAFKKDYPELAVKYLKKSSSLLYEVKAIG